MSAPAERAASTGAARPPAGEILGAPTRVRLASGLANALGSVGPEHLRALSARTLGEEVATHRSSWVRRAALGGTTAYLKTYDYPGRRDRVRGFLRNTWLAPSRAAREWQALEWLRRHGFAAPEPLGLVEWRWFGVLRRALLITAAWPGRPLSQVLPELSGNARCELLRCLHAFVAALHRAGFRDRNLDLRNILAAHDGATWQLAKIDSPRHRLRRPGRAGDRLAAADCRRLSASLAALGIEWPGSPP